MRRALLLSPLARAHSFASVYMSNRSCSSDTIPEEQTRMLVSIQLTRTKQISRWGVRGHAPQGPQTRRGLVTGRGVHEQTHIQMDCPGTDRCISHPILQTLPPSKLFCGSQESAQTALRKRDRERYRTCAKSENFVPGKTDLTAARATPVWPEVVPHCADPAHVSTDPAAQPEVKCF